MTAKNISTIFFDAGGVLIYIKRRRDEIAQNLLLSMGYELEKIKAALQAGQKFDQEYFTTHQWIYNWKEEKDWLIGHYHAIAQATDQDNDYLGEKLFMLTFDTYEYALYSEVIEVLERVRHDYRLAVISNALPSLDWSFDALGIRKYFDSVIISAYEGVVKPDRTIYQRGMDRMGCKPEECLFIDDKVEHVEAAKSLGMVGYHLDRQKESLQALLTRTIGFHW